jgi:hypothetical protein
VTLDPVLSTICQPSEGISGVVILEKNGTAVGEVCLKVPLKDSGRKRVRVSDHMKHRNAKRQNIKAAFNKFSCGTCNETAMHYSRA